MEGGRADVPTEGEAESTAGLTPLLDLAPGHDPQTPEFFILEYVLQLFLLCSSVSPAGNGDNSAALR